jgi:signal transduction histidine kinase/CheY-like chemotaxis protein
MAKPSRFPVRLLLFTIVLLAALPPLLFSVLLLVQYADTERGRAEESLETAAKGVARSIDTEFVTALATLRALKHSVLLVNDDVAAFEERISRTTGETGQAFALFDAGGARVAATVAEPRSGIQTMDQAFLSRSATDDGTYVSSVMTDPGSGEAFAFVGLPIRRGGQVRWILGAFLYSEDFADVIGNPGVPSDWIVSIVDPSGTHIRRSHLNDKFSGRPLVADLVRHMQSGENGLLVTTSLEGIPLISYVAFAPRSGWAAAVGLPKANLEAPLRSSLQYLSVIGLIMTAVAVLLAFMFARILDRGFLTLRTAARSLDSGEVIEPRESAVREVHDVVAAMSQVSHNLRQRSQALSDLNESLESQVQERTSELVAEMSRRENSEAQLRQLQRIEAIGKLTGGIAHDFNNMLAVVISGLSLTRRRLARGDTDVERYIDSAMQGAESAANLTRRLLAFSRQQALNPQPVDCNRLIEEMAEIFNHTIPENIAIETRLDRSLHPILIDLAGLESAILNLVVNARDAMPEGGTIVIETSNLSVGAGDVDRHGVSSAGDYVTIGVADTGTGIPADILDKVFEPFFTTKEMGHGTGLGLSQVHGFIRQSGGQVGMESVEGEGTRVVLYLPRLADEVIPDPVSHPGGGPAVTAGNGETLLVVEDEEAVRQGTVAMLTELGYRVLEAEGGEAALELLAENPGIALMITDVVMPGMNGLQLAEEASRRHPGLRVLYATGYTRELVIQRGMPDAGRHLISKPYTIEALAAKVSEALGS